MDKKKKSLKKELEETLACSAFAEAGEPCPIGAGKKVAGKVKTAGKKGGVLKSVEETLACSAFAEAGIPCPIGAGPKGGKQKK
ncbi:MAG TPA: hypothetical protein VLA15_01570 [Desulfurivibrionaceae bacterium]|nr:hypothetical protein [Desulfurivibrionaceae bacterium]